MEFIETPLNGLWVIKHKRVEDNRGAFARTFCKKKFGQIDFDKQFVQFNTSLNFSKGTIRGMHYQVAPYCEIKLIRCVQGKVWDVAVDLRKFSETYLNHFAVELSAENMTSILIPEGFAHGFQTLEDNTALIYHHTEFYTPNADAGLRYNDPKLAIAWKLPVSVISEKDSSYQLINNNQLD